MKQINFLVDELTYQQIKEVLKKEKRSISSFMRFIISEKLKEEEEKEVGSN